MFRYRFGCVYDGTIYIEQEAIECMTLWLSAERAAATLV